MPRSSRSRRKSTKPRRQSRRESRYRSERRKSNVKFQPHGSDDTNPTDNVNLQHRRESRHRTSKHDSRQGRLHSKESHREHRRDSSHSRNRDEEHAGHSHSRRQSSPETIASSIHEFGGSRRARSHSRYYKHRSKLKDLINEIPRWAPTNAVFPEGSILLPQQQLQQRNKIFTPLCSMKSNKIKNACKWMLLAELILGVSKAAMRLIVIKDEFKHFRNPTSDNKNQTLDTKFSHRQVIYWLDVVFYLNLVACGAILFLGSSMTLKIPCLLHSVTAAIGVIVQIVTFALILISWDSGSGLGDPTFHSILVVHRCVWILAMFIAGFLSYVLYKKIALDDDLAHVTREMLSAIS